MKVLKNNDECVLLAEKVQERRPLAFPPNYTTACSLNLGPSCPWSEERNCDDSHKWKFYKFGTSGYTSEKSRIFTFGALLDYFTKPKLGFFELEFW